MMKHSGLQKEVLSLYRKILREAVKKDRTVAVAASSSNASDAASDTTAVPPSFVQLLHNTSAASTSMTAAVNPNTTTSTTTSYAASEFRKQASNTKRSDFKKIEYMIRKGEKHLKLLKMPGVQVVSGTSSFAGTTTTTAAAAASATR